MRIKIAAFGVLLVLLCVITVWSQSTTTTINGVPNQQLTFPGAIYSGSGSGVAGTHDFTAGTVPAIGANSFGIGVGPTMTTSQRLQSPNDVAVAHSLMVIGAPSSNISTWAYKAVPDCTDTGGNHLNFTQSTDVFSCGTTIPTVALTSLATQAADTVVMNATGGSASPTAVAMPACTTGADLYNTTTHAWSCVSTGGGGSISLDLLKGAALLPDSTGGAFFEPYAVKATNDFWNYQVLTINDTGTTNCVYLNYTAPDSTSKVVKLVWTSTATTGAAVFTFDYRVVGGTDTTSLDQATAQESLSATTNAPTAANNRIVSTMTETATIAAGDTIQGKLCRTSGAGGDTMAAAATIHGFYLTQ